jgi:steroid delta-isomerase-like uncharacterized protein
MGQPYKPETPTTASASSKRDSVALVRSFYAAFNNRQFEGVLGDIANDCEWTDVASGMVLRGPEGWRQYNEGWLTAFPDGKIEVINVTSSGDLVTVEFVGRGTQDGPLMGLDGSVTPPSHRRVELRLMDVYQFRGDKVVRGRTYYDAMTLMRQVAGAATPETKKPSAVVHQPGEGKGYWMLDSLYDVRLSSNESGGKLTVVEMTVPEGHGPPPHTHPGEETVYVLEGRLRFNLDGKTHEAGPGAIFHIPRGTVENFEPIGRVRVLAIYSPGGIDGFFAEAGDPAMKRELPSPSDTPPDLERIVRIGAKHGLNIQLPEK